MSQHQPLYLEEEFMKRNLILGALVAILAFSLTTTPAWAQATRTWVSGVGDDANPCSRTAPCKTFAGAISKTATGGEINVLDPGGFGAVTITKPITISSWGFEAGVLVSGTNAIIVSVPNATDTVILRGLDIEGLGTGLSGVIVLTGGNVTIENCTIHAFTDSGIKFTPTVAGSFLHVSNTIVRDNGALPNSGQGILVSPSGAASADFDHVRIIRNIAGLKVMGGQTSVTDSVAASNLFAGFSGAASGAILNIENSMASHNGTGVVCATGATVRMGHLSLTDNGAATGGTGSCLSFKNNDAEVTLSVTAINPSPQ
jgi:hypothetical protein